MMRRAALVALALATALPAAASDKSPQRAVLGAGWTASAIADDSGQHLFQRFCYECHGDGPFHPGTQALAAKYGSAEPALLEQRTDLTTDFVIHTVRHGISVMPSMRKTEIGDTELKAIAAYLTRNNK